MNINIIYPIIITSLALLSLFILSTRFVAARRVPIDFTSRSFFVIKERYYKLITNQQVASTDKLLMTTINTSRYIFLHGILLVITIFLGLIMLTINTNSVLQMLFILVISLYFVSFPKTIFLGKKTPYKYLLEFLENKHKKQIDFELYKLTLHLKNLATASKYKNYSANYILSTLYKSANLTKPVIGKMISLWELGQTNNAGNLFSEAIGTRIARELTVILKKLDDLTTEDLIAQIDLLLQLIRKERETNRLIANENRSNLIYFSVIVTTVAIMLNFVVIVYYLEAINNIQLYIN